MLPPFPTEDVSAMMMEMIEWENRPFYCRECETLVYAEHFKNHAMSPTLIVKLCRERWSVELYCVFCKQLIEKAHTISTSSLMSLSLAKKLSKHFLNCIGEPAEGWSDEADRLIQDFLLKRLFRPRDRLRISVNLLQAKTIRDSGLQR